MANTDRPRGLMPVRHLNGVAWNGMTTKVFIASSDATAIYIGDIVKYIGSSPAAGTVKFGEDVSGVPMVARVTASGDATAAWAGVVVGFKPNPDNLMQKHRPASTDRIAYICTDPSVVYEIQEDADTTPVAAASIGLNANIAFGAGSATTGLSGLELDSNTVDTTAALPLKVLGLVKRVDNDFNSAGAGSDNAKFEVLINYVNGLTPGAVGI